ncbi:MAG: 23S rRNA (adenine(2503)-C(2))-methyltransferase RlmN [Candidatus Omnitrophica bacterium]|jgi:23S rRNA (adenine2503-C2)-methyltransferase|nr:23S rRNA (adenine(2503)-C(2))-methyltransferase RlmN [Candidatus Omnitrophota bacterium]MDD5661473.1 23S rRNA (adenine(2503)-C(2))-methyltransferase RlmN [Candidatus Omnitrophota bacterium]
MQDIKEFNLKELRDKLLNLGSHKYYAQAIFNWIYQKGACEFSSMSNLPVSLRHALALDFYILGSALADLQVSSDKTAKFLFELKDANLVEAVSIPVSSRLTACISSQAGCKFSCNFCASGLKGFKRNLTKGEILDEVLYLKNNAKVNQLTHIVFMGTGEPLDNYDNVLEAIRIINSPVAFNIGARRITISTCGIIPGIERLNSEDLQIELSISLHAPDDQTRSRLMPVNKKYPLAALIKCCHEYTAKTNRQITFEYILIKGINSGLVYAQKLVMLLKDLKLAKVNLIPANPVFELKIFPPSQEEVNSFKECLFKAGINVTLRKERGQDIDAACGQLRLKHEKK